MTTALLLVAVLAQATTPPPASSQEGRAELRGRVVDKDTGRPLARARVYLLREPDFSKSTSSDDSGIFQFTGLLAGRYSGMVDPGPLRGTHLMQPIGGATESTRWVTLGAADIVDLVVALPRARTIGVRVVDEFGDPLAQIRIVAREASSGRIAATSAMWGGGTDDRGRIRVFGLPPGKYTLCTESSALGTYGSLPKDETRMRLVSTCYPSALNDDDAEAVSVEKADLEGVEIRVRRGRTYTIAGRIVDGTGAPASGAFIGLREYSASGSSGGSRLNLQADGTFIIANVHPGSYALEASLGGEERPEQPRPRERAYLPLRVDADIDDVLLTMTRGVDVKGQIVLEDPSGQLPRPSGAGLMVGSRLWGERLRGQGSAEWILARADKTFELKGTFGARVIGILNVPRGWYLKSIHYQGKDITDAPVDFTRLGESGPLELTLSNRGAELTGRVLDDLGNPVPRARVLVFRTDATLPGAAATATSSAAGTFQVGPLREGDYRIVAFSPPVDVSQDWAQTEKLAALGERVSLSELERRSLDVVVRKQ